MKNFTALLFTTILSAVVAVIPAFATEPAGKDMHGDELSLVESKAKESGEVRYISGGVGISGMKTMDEEEHAYNLKMLFVAEPDGHYLADISVRITSDKGKTVLETTAEGPVLLVRIKPGHYTVSATRATGFTMTRKVEASGDHLSTYVLRYPVKE
jgi:hypothetical protein